MARKKIRSGKPLRTPIAKGLGWQIWMSKSMTRKATRNAWRKRITKYRRKQCLTKADAKRLRKLVHRVGIIARRNAKLLHRRGR